MPKLMGPVSGSINASTLEPMVNDRSNATGPSKTADGGFDAQKYAPTGALWPSTPQIRWRSLRQLPQTKAIRYAGRSCRGHSTVPRSSLCYRARETPLHRNANPGVRAGARWRNRDTPPGCAGRCWPATDGPGPPESLGVSMTSTSWLRSGTAAAKSSFVLPR